jgi:hypothetical protein
LFRLPPSSEALTAVEERLDSGVKAEAFRNVTDPNIPGIVLKRVLSALDPPLIDKYAAVVDAVRLNKFTLLVDVLRKMEPAHKATLNYLITFLRYLAEPTVAEKVRIANVCALILCF